MAVVVERTRDLSPELVLVDPGLAERARASLPERPWEHPERRVRAVRGAPPRPVVPIVRPGVAARTVTAAPPATRKGRSTVRRAAVGAALAALAAALAVLTSLSPADAPRLAPRPADEQPADPRRPAVPPRVPPQGAPRTLAWAPAPSARRYEVALFRGDAQILSAKTSEPRFVVPQAWKFAERRHTLTAARYRWYVWPLDRKGGKLVRRDPVVQATFTIAG